MEQLPHSEHEAILKTVQENKAYLKAIFHLLGEIHGVPSERLNKLYREYLEEGKVVVG